MSAIDQDVGATLTYSITWGADASKFKIDPNSGALSFIDPPDFENPTDSLRSNQYKVQVQASDSQLVDAQLLTVIVGNQVGKTINGTAAVNIIDATHTVVGQALPSNEEDTISGLNGNDQISSLGGNDKLSGGNGNDTLNGGTGNDRLSGDAGNDTFVFALGDGNDTIAESGQGTGDSVQVRTNGISLGSLAFSDTGGGNGELLIEINGQSISVTDHFAGGANVVESLVFSGGATFAGFAIGNTSYLLSADDAGVRNGTSGNNIVAGDAAANSIDGAGGVDLLFGAAGNDRLTGGLGRDLLVGGDGGDTFDFNGVSDSGTTGGTRDVIADFKHGIDKIDLATIDAKIGGSDNAFLFGGASVVVKPNSVSWFETGGQTIVQLDNNGNATAELTIALAGTGLGLTAGDFIL